MCTIPYLLAGSYLAPLISLQILPGDSVCDRWLEWARSAAILSFTSCALLWYLSCICRILRSWMSQNDPWNFRSFFYEPFDDLRVLELECAKVSLSQSNLKAVGFSALGWLEGKTVRLLQLEFIVFILYLGVSKAEPPSFECGCSTLLGRPTMSASGCSSCDNLGGRYLCSSYCCILVSRREQANILALGMPSGGSSSRRCAWRSWRSRDMSWLQLVSSLRVGKPLQIDITIITRINHQFPQHFFFSEETGLSIEIVLDPSWLSFLTGELPSFCFLPRLMPQDCMGSGVLLMIRR